MSHEKKEYDSIYHTRSRPGILYGSAKVHKPIINNCPSFRPILPVIGTQTYDLGKFLVHVLSALKEWLRKKFKVFEIILKESPWKDYFNKLNINFINYLYW